MYIYLGAKSRGSDAVQNVWMINSANFVLTKIRPKVFWGENAPGLFTTGIIYIQLIRPSKPKGGGWGINANFLKVVLCLN